MEIPMELSSLFVHGFPLKPLRLIPANVYQTGPFSSPVAAFITEIYKQLQPNSSDTTVLLLTQSSQQLSSGTPISVPSSQPSQAFRPSRSAVRMNTLWVPQPCAELDVPTLGDAHATVGAEIPPGLPALVRAVQACAHTNLLR
ncbi:hypothetical protein BJV78DRAFT_1284430 [Lactifluus subvellereus]|nr:hypothetical protein BJV78DRAFT_1284430 [Lactifluus subvellereus]